MKNPNTYRGGPVRFQPRLQIPPQFTLKGLPILFHWIMYEARNRRTVALPHRVEILR